MTSNPTTDTHPVLQLMRKRKLASSKPGKRDDDAKLALVIEGGGMRGIVSAAMTAAIEQLGFLDTIDQVYGTSAGSLNGAFLLSGQASWSCTLYYDYLNQERFLDLNRLLLGKPAIDMEYLANDVYGHERKLNYNNILKNPIPLHCVATEIKNGKSIDLTGFATAEDIEGALLATSRIPFLVGEPYDYKGVEYVDAAMSDPIPLDLAVSEGATHVLVLQTRPEGVSLSNSFLDPIVERYLNAISPALEDLYEARSEKYEETLKLIEHKSQKQSLNPSILASRVGQDIPVVRELEKDKEKLLKGAMAGYKVMQEMLTGMPVVVEEVISAFPASWYSEAKHQ